MGNQKVNSITERERAVFIRHLLQDIEALELMLEQNTIESGITRIGAEQEFCLVNKHWRPSNKSNTILKHINDSHFTTELAQYNLEINLDPVELGTNSFTIVETQLKHLLNKANTIAKKYNTKLVLTGILPTISKKELELDYMTPNQRYYALNEMIKGLRGSDINLHFNGVDELSIMHDSVLFEACNTSFQMHLQVDPDDFISSYNWAQAIAGPVLGICANSPLLLGRELWNETRIALFQQSIDTRSSSYALKDQLPRVAFGESWASGSIADIFKNDISRYKIILSKNIKTNSLEALKSGKIPKLEALNVHNGTIYRWNRPCYGVGGGKAHVRIENRYLPAGPSVIDEIANFAFWVGLMVGRPKVCDNMSEIMDFRDAKSNFLKSARTGKESVLRWMGNQVPVTKLITKKLLPIAYAGLQKAKIDSEDINRLLKIIEQRVSGNTGTQWKVKSYRKLRENVKQDDALVSLTQSIHQNQKNDTPVHEWSVEAIPRNNKGFANCVGHIMSTQLFTVSENDLAELAISIMQWKNVHHVPVENDLGQLVGLLTWNHIKLFNGMNTHKSNTLVSDIMVKDVITAETNTKIKKAILTMKNHEIGCLPIIQNDHLVGIVTTNDVKEFDES